MPDDVIAFSFLAEAKVPVWYLKPGETIFKEARQPPAGYACAQ